MAKNWHTTKAKNKPETQISGALINYWWQSAEAKHSAVVARKKRWQWQRD